jgi:kinesin family member 2/24
MQASEQPKIRVVIRKRPLNRKEVARGEQDVVEVAHSNQVIVREQKYTSTQ